MNDEPLAPGPPSLLRRVAVSLAIVTMVVSCTVGWLAYRTSWDLVSEQIRRSSLELARTVSAFGELLATTDVNVDIDTQLTNYWSATERRHPGSYLCLIDRSGRLLTHTQRTDEVGRDVGDMRLGATEGTAPPTVAELIRTKQDWVGRARNLAGDKQMIAFAYNRALDGLVAIHVPAADIDRQIRASSLPWAIAVGFTSLILLPLSIFLLHRAHSSADRLAAIHLQNEQRLEDLRASLELSVAERTERIRAIVSTAVEGIITIDADGVIESFNPAAEGIFGWTEQEITGRNISTLMPEPYRGEHNEYLARYLKTGHAKIIGIGREVQGRRKDGTTFPIDLAVSEFRIGGRPMFAGIVRDITERESARKELLEYQGRLRALTSELSLSEERQRREIATELHDQIGQNLAITKIKLGEAQQTAAPDGVQDLVTETRELVEQTIQSTRTLTFELGSPVLYELGLEAAIESLADDIQERHGIASRFNDDGSDKPLSDDLRVVLFQSVRELLNNVVKHANARHVDLSIARETDLVEIVLTDDGAGFQVPKGGFRVSKEGRFGLFNIRERVEHLGGRVEVESSPGAGTRVSLSAPLSAGAGTEGHDDEPTNHPG
ncbi:MAG: hypothetical protein CMJ18_23345 [Phycisphaeraceae bacterium]|nr:hypothetical protein [Phycisphaeraceae bacterium]